MKTKQEIQSIIKTLSVEEKVGQLFLLAYPGKDPKAIEPIIQKYGICGCYLSQDNAETFDEARDISEQLQQMGENKNGIPLLLGVDQEGAWGILVPQSHPGPGNMALAAANDTSLTQAMYEIIGKEMAYAGFNSVLGPCADVNSNPKSPIIGTRSFGEFPDQVAENVQAAISGLKSAKSLSCIKHFPGHGATESDTHRLIPEVNKTLAELLDSDLIPFKAGIDVGCDIVMTSHIKYPKIDDKNPATLSSTILQNILRDMLGYQGVILSDSMNMGAIRRVYDPAESTLQALKSGVDIVMLSEEHYDHELGNYLDNQIKSLELVVSSINAGSIPMDLIDAKLFRILDLKFNKMLAHHEDMFSADDYQSNAQTIASICDKTIGLLQRRAWPLPKADNILCINATPNSSYENMMNSRGIGPNQAKPAFDTFFEELSHSVSCRKVSFEQCMEDTRELETASGIILVSEDYPLPGEDFEKNKQQQLIREISLKWPEKTIIVGLRSSYEILEYPEDVTYVCSYSSRTCSAQAAARFVADAPTKDIFTKPPVSVRF